LRYCNTEGTETGERVTRTYQKTLLATRKPQKAKSVMKAMEKDAIKVQETENSDSEINGFMENGFCTLCLITPYNRSFTPFSRYSLSPTVDR